MKFNNLLFSGILFLILSQNVFSQTDPIKIISSINVQNDYNSEGVIGMNITIKYNFLALEEWNHDDSILKNADFSFATKIIENNKPVEADQGFTKFTSNNAEFYYKMSLLRQDVQASVIDKTIDFFIPYAALKLTEGKHTLTLKTDVLKFEDLKTTSLQKFEKNNVDINKPPVQVVTFDIDYIELNTLNTKGNSWDVGIFKPDAPDIDVSINLSSATLWHQYQNDSYTYSLGSKSHNLTFAISKGDIITLYIQDLDIIFHDYVAKWQFDMANKVKDQIYVFDTAKGNIKSCKLTYKLIK